MLFRALFLGLRRNPNSSVLGASLVGTSERERGERDRVHSFETKSVEGAA